MSAISTAPLLCLCLIFLFLCSLPALNLMREPEEEIFSVSKRREVAAIAAVTIVYAMIAFYGLGSASAPRTFLTVNRGTETVLEADGSYSCGSISIWSGLGTGSCTVELSEDGESWSYYGSLDQSYASLMRWHIITPESGSAAEFRYLRLRSDADLELGELAVFTGEGTLAGWKTDCELFDEQSLAQESSDFYNSSYFDEIYHARTAWEHIRNISPYEISHPPLGKLIIALGMLIFGVDPFGWRFMGTLFGVLMLPLIYVFGKKLYKNRFAALCTAILLASEFMHYNQTRIATIDTYSVFFILLMYLFMYMYVTDEKPRDLFLSGMFFGLGCASKWTCVYAGAGLAVIWAIKRFEMRGLGFRAFLKNCMFCVLAFILVPFAIYYCSYWRYGTAAGLSGPGMLLSREYWDIFAGNQSFMFNYHSGITATHPYSSRWYQWIFDIRPILYYLTYNDDGTRTTFGCFMNPLICWSGIICLILLIYPAVFKKDRRAGFVIIGYLAQIVPWTFVTRITFEYHYFPSSVFLILGLGLIIDFISRLRRHGRIFCSIFTGLSAALFCYFYPILGGIPISSSLITKLYGWLPTWPF